MTLLRRAGEALCGLVEDAVLIVINFYSRRDFGQMEEWKISFCFVLKIIWKKEACGLDWPTYRRTHSSVTYIKHLTDL